MNPKAVWTMIIALALFWAVAAGLAKADLPESFEHPLPKAATVPLGEPTVPTEPTVPPEPTSTTTSEPTVTSTATSKPTPTSTAIPHPGVQVVLKAVPTQFCPGWNLYYRLYITNTSQIAPLTSLVITDALPVGTWYLEGGISGTIPGEYDSASEIVTWQAAVVAPGEMVEAHLDLHSYSSLQDGTVITNTFVYSAPQLSELGSISSACIVDSSICAETSTPTPTATLTPTPWPTPMKPRLFLPLISKEVVRTKLFFPFVNNGQVRHTRFLPLVHK